MAVRIVPSFMPGIRACIESTYSLTPLGNIVPPPGKRNFSPSFFSQCWFDFCLLIQSYGTFLSQIQILNCMKFMKDHTFGHKKLQKCALNQNFFARPVKWLLPVPTFISALRPSDRQLIPIRRGN